MNLALIAHPFAVTGDVDPLGRLVAQDPWFAAASRVVAPSASPGPTAQPGPGSPLTIEWLVARDIDTYRARRRDSSRSR
ncbi:hypothetical protein EQW78_04785 [Oerskovia turbata]|uniref:Uncharacterized protein n=1 Tax=Oerskovia turbata TaxID=1713 RepID=A0A4V1N5H1_9CELL|nr:hypothetical protein [Oerskovia turbata]RXR27916.1 hypothetical protein EQW73_00965 [Oerskovia turbata]RXR35646.1 hypothetical protein EQW78_04785 [Oerskovia turbata]TGJ96625.1 hypothetical protein DLJ96_00525 [Actinotalea fermentans ATCC 43279 = JCM 9966 = DSM 3133]